MTSVSGVHLARLLADWRLALPSGPAYARLAAAVRALLVDGRLPLAARLPAERELATRLGVSRTTVTAAYDALRADGYLHARQGAGTFTALPDEHVHQVAGWTAVRSAPGLDLAVASSEALPGVVEAAVARAVPRLGRHLRGHGYDVLGLVELREAVAARYAARGLPTSPDQVVVTAGALAATGLVARALLGPGDRVVVDTPTYPNALDVVRRAGGRLAGVALDDDGWDLERVEAAYRSALPRLGHVVADFANPTGHVLPEADRARLVRAAACAGTTLVVDETLADVWLDAPPPPPVAAFDDDDGVVTVGSLSKSHWGGLRVGWVRAPRGLVARLAESRSALDLAPPVLEQLVAAELLADEDALDRRRALLRARRAALAAGLQEHCPGWTWREPAGGLVLWVRLDAPVATALAAAAERHGVRLVPAGRFSVDGTGERHVRVPFALPEPVLADAARRLAAARAELDGVRGVPLAAVT
ncbi:MAG TPA: PLP-dependent aminotransferase family protein [Mycobacteriales bacterium]|nr:PLP-dependent aminotransferase family protein [Mycobacteriales bacterium]